jgi:hypothetical protein
VIVGVLFLALAAPAFATSTAGASESWAKYKTCEPIVAAAFNWQSNVDAELSKKKLNAEVLFNDASSYGNKDLKLLGCRDSPDKTLNSEVLAWAEALSSMQLDLLQFTEALQVGVGSVQKTGVTLERAVQFANSLGNKATKRFVSDFTAHHLS